MTALGGALSLMFPKSVADDALSHLGDRPIGVSRLAAPRYFAMLESETFAVATLQPGFTRHFVGTSFSRISRLSCDCSLAAENGTTVWRLKMLYPAIIAVDELVSAVPNVDHSILVSWQLAASHLSVFQSIQLLICERMSSY